MYTVSSDLVQKGVQHIAYLKPRDHLKLLAFETTLNNKTLGKNTAQKPQLIKLC